MKFIIIPLKIIYVEKLIKINRLNFLKTVCEIIKKSKFSNTLKGGAKKKWRRFYNSFEQDTGCTHKNIIYPEFLIRNANFLRVNDNYYYTQNKYANINILNWILIDYLKKNKINNISKCNILELGAGYGYNLINIYKKFSNINKILVSDFSNGSLQTAKINLKKNKIKKFEIKKIDYKNKKHFKFKDKIDIVITRHALEQSKDSSIVINNIFRLAPKIVIHIEPISDFYNQSLKFDKLAYKYHQKRGYLNSFIDDLKKNNKIKINSVVKYKFGNMFNDSCGAIAWSPK